MKEFFEKLKSKLGRRLEPFGDTGAWVLFAVSALPLLLIDRAMFITLIQWVVFGLALGGVAVILSRVLLPQIKLTRLVEKAEDGNLAAGAVAGAVIVFLGLLLMSIVLWARA